MNEPTRRRPEAWAIDVALLTIVVGSLAWIGWYHIQGIRIDGFLIKAIEALNAGDLDAFYTYREAGGVLLEGQQSWTLLVAFVCSATGLIFLVHRHLQRMVYAGAVV
jgi:hypothetical protein